MSTGAGIPQEQLVNFDYSEIEFAEMAENPPQAERSLYKDNSLPKTDRLLFLAETAKIHRKFLRDIVGWSNLSGQRRRSELVIFTGSTYDLAAEPLSVAAHIEHMQPDDLPEIASWNSTLYFQEHAAAPNSIVYKYISQETVQIAKRNADFAVQYAVFGVLDKWDEQVAAESEVLQKNLEPEAVAARIEELLTFNSDPESAAKNKYIAVQVIQKVGLDLKLLPNDLKEKLRKVTAEIEVGVRVGKTFGNEVVDLQRRLSLLERDLTRGKYSEVQQLDGKNNFKLPNGQLRVDLMKVLYPEFLQALFHEDGSPKEIAFYDNVSITGEKTNAYLSFLQALGVADKARIYLMYTKPGAHAELERTPTEVMVGKEIEANFVRYSMDNVEDARFLGKTHDRTMKFDVPEKGYGAEPIHNGVDSEQNLQRRRLLAYLEQLQLPEFMGEVERRVQQLKGFVHNDKNDFETCILDYLSHAPLARIITPTYADYGPAEYRRFEETFNYEAPGPEKKKYFQAIKNILEQVSQFAEANPETKTRLIYFDSSLRMILKAFLRLPQFQHLAGKLVFDDYYTLTQKVKDKADIPEMRTLAINSSFLNIEYDSSAMENLQTAGVRIEKMWVVSDERRKYTPEQRKKKIKDFLQKLRETTSEFGVQLQALQSESVEERIDALKGRFLKKKYPLILRATELSDLQRLLHSGAEILQQDLQALHDKEHALAENQPKEVLLETEEYKAFAKDALDLVAYGEKLYGRIIEKLEKLSQLSENEDMSIYEELLKALTEIESEFKNILIIRNVLRNLNLIRNYDEKYGKGKISGEQSKTNVFDVFDEIGLFSYSIESHVKNLSRNLHDAYDGKYYTGADENQAPVVVQSSEHTSEYYFPVVYSEDVSESEKMYTKAIQISRHVELLRYMTEVIAWEENPNEVTT